MEKSLDSARMIGLVAAHMTFAKATAVAALIALAPGQMRAQDRKDKEAPRNLRARSTRSVAPSAIQRELIALLISGARQPALRGEEQWLENQSALLERLGTIHTSPAIRALAEGDRALACRAILKRVYASQLKRGAARCSDSKIGCQLCG